MSGSDPDQPPLDRTQMFRPDGAEPPATDLPRIPGITLHHEIARGGMGVVYSGRQDFLDRRVAVKLLSMDLVGEKFAQRFQREAKLLAGIKHPHIVACHSAGTTDDGQSYLVMEFVDGPSLKAWVVEQGALPAIAALRLTRSVAQALAHAHQLGVIHRDVKPENILLESVTSTALDIAFPYVPKLVDLGLARMTSETAGLGLTSPGSVMGTPATMSPEQFDDPDSVDFRTDIYGLGCALYEMLVGAAAYRGKKLTEIVTQKRQPIGPNPCVEAPHVPVAVGALVCSMLAANRDDRPRSYRELDDRIGELLATMPTMALPPKPPPRRVEEETARTMARGAPPSSSPKTGPGLLRTAEIDFLQEGLGAGVTATPAFREGPATAPPEAPRSTASPTVAPAPPPSRRGLWLTIGGVAAALIVVGWFATRGGDGPGEPGSGGGAVPKPSTNQPPTGARITGADAAVGLSQWVTLTALAQDPDGDRLRYRWSVPDEVQQSAQEQNTIRVRAIDGLPGAEFGVSVAIDDGQATVEATTSLKLSEEGFATEPFLATILSDTRWRFDPPQVGLDWVKLNNQDIVACNAVDVRRTASLAMGSDTFWSVRGRLSSRFTERYSDYGAIAVRLELGDVGWSLVCRQTGDFGAQWSVEPLRERRLAGAWEPDPTGEPSRRVAWVEADDVQQTPFAEVTVTRRRDEIELRWGQGERFERQVVPIPDGTEPVLSLWGDRGGGEYHDFSRQ